MSDERLLGGLRVQRIDRPAAGLVSFVLTGRGKKLFLILCCDDRHVGGGLVEERPRGEPADGFTRRLRKELGNGRVLEVEPGPGALRLGIAVAGGRRSVVVEAAGARGNVLLLNDGKIAGALDTGALRARNLGPGAIWSPPGGPVPPWADAETELRRLGKLTATRRIEDRLSGVRTRLRRSIRTAARRLTRRLEAIEADAARAEHVPAMRAEADLIAAHLHAYQPGSSTLTVVDYGHDPPIERSLAVDPRDGARGQMERLYHRARRLTRGAELAVARRAETRADIDRLSGLAQRVEAASELSELETLADEADRLGARGARDAVDPMPRRRRPQRKRLAYRTFLGSGGRKILVGRGAADNDTLTVRTARPHDLWLHARGRTGAHVVVPLQKGETCPPDVLVDAAALAVHFSDAAGEDRVEVSHTPRRYIRKPRGAAPGLVLVHRERVLILRHEPERIRRLIASEVV